MKRFLSERNLFAAAVILVGILLAVCLKAGPRLAPGPAILGERLPPEGAYLFGGIARRAEIPIMKIAILVGEVALERTYMKSLHSAFMFAILSLIALAACGPVSGVPLGLKPTPTPTYVPPLVGAPLGVKPACDPPVPSISNVNSFCANQGAGLGGATFLGPASYNTANYTGNLDCSWNSDPVVCSGPPNTEFQVTYCMSCGEPEPQALGAFVCSNGFVKDAQGICSRRAEMGTNQGYGPCPAGTHYNNDAQNCADDITQNIVPQCPDAFPYYNPDFHYCLAKAYPEVFDCQTFTLQLGDCSVQPHNPKVKGCGQYADQRSCEANSCVWLRGTCQSR